MDIPSFARTRHRNGRGRCLSPATIANAPAACGDLLDFGVNEE